MDAIWQFALQYPEFLVVPACGFVLALLLLRVKKKYVTEGILFGRSSCKLDEDTGLSAVEDEVNPGKAFDLTLALRTFEELGLEEGGARAAYWFEAGQLLRWAADMQVEMELLDRHLERCRAMLSRSR